MNRMRALTDLTLLLNKFGKGMDVKFDSLPVKELKDLGQNCRMFECPVISFKKKNKECPVI